MGKTPYTYTDSEDTEDGSSSVENLKKKKKMSILKYSAGSLKKKKCKVHSISDPDESEFQPRGSQRFRKIRGILKHDKEREFSTASDDDDDMDSTRHYPNEKFLVGVPRRSTQGKGGIGGLAILVRKSGGLPALQSLQSQGSSSSTKRRRSLKGLGKKRSY